ncbi:MAG: hypothetical protein LBG58_07400 [Planctomycetaceae bacterium]|nr:hypothetical protein [Planctomycetaceae bacterium]
MEQRVLTLRKYLKEKSILGHYGAQSIRNEMIRRGEQFIPKIRTIAYIIKRHGLVDQRTRKRQPPPPPGWYLSDLVNQKVELDSFDIVEHLYLFGGEEIQLLNGISLHGSLICSVAKNTINTEITIQTLIDPWKIFGLPKYVPFDNDMVFQGSRKPNMIGKVIRLCLSLGVIPIFVTPYEQGFQQKFWRRKRFKNSSEVRQRLKK